MEGSLLREEKDHVLTLSINRREKRNALNPEIMTGIRETLGSLKPGGPVRVVILRGAGQEAFCSGMDLGAGLQGEHREGLLLNALRSVIDCPCPVIAMVYGYALGGGCDLALACDMRVAADTAKFAMPPVRFGWVHPPGMVQCFINVVGMANTKEMFLTARTVAAERALQMGLVNYVLPTTDVEPFTFSLAEEIAANAPLALAGTKRVIKKLAYQSRFTSADRAEIKTIMETGWNSKDAAEGLRAFHEKRRPNFQGR